MTPVIVPTVTAYDVHEYRLQMERAASFAQRIHIDLMDGVFAPTKSPDVEQLWLPTGIQCDIHVMFQHPDKQIKKVLALNPSLVIVQSEANKESVRASIRGLKKTRVRAGVSLLPPTRVDDQFVSECIRACDYVLIFSGILGFHGGSADLGLLEKISDIRRFNPTCEIAWDGGINLENAKTLATAGINVLNTGGAIQKSLDPEGAYRELCALVA